LVRPADRSGWSQVGRDGLLAELLGQRDDDPLRAADVAEPVAVLVLRHLSNEFRAVDAGKHGRMKGVEVLGSRILLSPSEPERSRRFYRDTLGLAVYREFGHPDDPGLVFFLGGGFLEVSGRSTHVPGSGLALWIQVRDVEAERRRLLAAGVSVVRGPQQELWGLVEMWIEDPDGVRIVLVEVPSVHPLRRDKR
jgi:catechol 2,3-dioxygenase-like lactoylglutathione lyase family enzyme